LNCSGVWGVFKTCRELWTGLELSCCDVLLDYFVVLSS